MLSLKKRTGLRHFARWMMGSFFEIQLEDKDLAVAVFHEIKRVEKQLSRFDAGSEISRINAEASDRPVTVSPEVMELLVFCRDVSMKTGGLFDVTAAAWTHLWDKAQSRNILPTEQEMDAVRSLVGSEKLQLDSSAGTVFFSRKGMSLDLGAVGKGYALDCAVDLLRSSGVSEALLSCGSTVFSLGRKSKKVLLDGRGSEAVKNHVIHLADQAVSTSSQDERFRIIQGRRYGHIIDPLTGLPCRSDDIQALSVSAPTAALSDALATASFLAGLRCGLFSAFPSAQVYYSLPEDLKEIA